MAESTSDASVHSWQVARKTCRACEVLEAEVSNDVEAGRRFGVKYSVNQPAHQ